VLLVDHSDHVHEIAPPLPQLAVPTPPPAAIIDGGCGDERRITMLRTRSLAVIATASLLAVVAALAILSVRSRGQLASTPAQPVVVEALPAPSYPPTPVPPPLETASDDHDLSLSDEVVRAMVGELSSHPALASWLLSDRLVRRFAEAVEMVAAGMSPVDQLEFLRPDTPFVVHRRQGRLVIAPSSFRRYDLAAEVFVSIDSEGAVALLRRLEPHLGELHAELAWYDGDFEDRLVEAMDHLLEVEVPEGPMVVRAGVLTYAYADHRLEDLSDAQRHLLRMGPTNATRVQAKLRQLRAELRPEPVFDADQLGLAAACGGVVSPGLPPAAAGGRQSSPAPCSRSASAVMP
jgi:hypothetical protein